MYFLGGLKEKEAFYKGLGIDNLNDANFLILFTLVLLPFVMFFVGPFISWLQRKYEFEADEYACKFAKPADLKQSLIKAVKLSDAVAKKQLNERTDITNPNIGPKQINTFLTAGNILQKIGIIKASVSIKDVVKELVDTSFLTKN